MSDSHYEAVFGTGIMKQATDGSRDLRHPMPTAVSEDGLHFDVLEPPVFDWGDLPAHLFVDAGGIVFVDGRYYLPTGIYGFDEDIVSCYMMVAGNI